MKNKNYRMVEKNGKKTAYRINRNQKPRKKKDLSWLLVLVILAIIGGAWYFENWAKMKHFKEAYKYNQNINPRDWGL